MTHRGAASSRCFHNGRDFCFELARKKYSFSKRISGREALNIFHWDPILHSGEECKRTVGSCQGKNAGRHVPFITLVAWLSTCSQADDVDCSQSTWTVVNCKLSRFCWATLTDFEFPAGQRENSWEFIVETQLSQAPVSVLYVCELLVCSWRFLRSSVERKEKKLT